MAVSPVARSGAPIRPNGLAGAGAAATGAHGDPAPPEPGPDGVVRSDAAKAAYQAWLKGQMRRFFEEIIATATKKHH